MRFNLLWLYLLLLSGCASSVHQNQQVSKEASKQQEAVRHAPISLDRMDTQFLYLASQQALGHGQPALATRFLKALVKKEPQDIEPRLELVDLLLTSGNLKQIKEAQYFMDGMPDDSVKKLNGDQLARYQLLYARSLISNGETEKAAILLQELLEARPENIQVRLLLVRLYAVNQDYSKAHYVLSQGLELKKDIHLQQMQVQLYLQQGKLKQADRVLVQMQKDYPEDETVILERAQIAEQQNNPNKAEAILQSYIKKHPEEAVQSYGMLAALLVRQNKLNEATIVYQRMLPLTANSADVLMSLGKIFYQQQNYTEAQRYFKQAIVQLTPQKDDKPLTNARATAVFYLGASMEASHDWQHAIPQYQQLDDNHDLYLDAQLRLVSIDLTQKKYKAAESRLKQLQHTFKHELRVYEMLSGLRLQQKRYQDVIQESEKVLDSGFSQVLLFNRAVAYENLKQYQKLDETLDMILSKVPDDAEALNFYGYSLADRGERLADAQRMVEQALKIKPNDGYYLDSLAWVFYKQKAYTKALTTQRKAVELINNDPVMLEHLGDMYWKNDKAEQARELWQKAIDMEHDDLDSLKLKIKRGLM